ncbi:hypothetical protein PV728_47410 [Streptomyces europaeiscabiei]|uniref:hypothetical protein n=1 Tax=Streptomyces europaeiscabiei TaxID=146819 RepID=UPI00299FA9AD|nr:hypothetical protein [Streptomyces europaeiscabiei]MDX3637678.1 hypothetical protein [Streptomyces europaeiscabiei]MDX3655509.1 hypothetical protein [Streptomyces europaeiscabiei]
MTTVIAGQTVDLLSQWYDFEGGPLTDLDTAPSITIARISNGTVIVATTTTGVTHPGVGSYGYGWTPAADLAVGDYLATWSGLKGGSPVAAAETVTVSEPISGRSYATVEQFDAYPGTTVSATTAARLQEATALLDSRILRLCWYAVDAAGLPTNSVVATAFARAVCAQVRWWDDLGGTTSGAGSAGWGSVKIGSVQLSRSVTSVSGADSPEQQIAPTVWDELMNPQLTPDRFALGVIVS